MKPDDQDLAIAEASGYYTVRPWATKPNALRFYRPDGTPVCHHKHHTSKESAATCLPAFTKDETAIKAAVRQLFKTESERTAFLHALQKVAVVNSIENWFWYCVTATAAQVAEAAVRALKLWEEEEK